MTFQNLQTELRNRLSAQAGHTFYSDTMIASWINLAHKWAAGLHKWPMVKKAKTTTTVASQEYYAYPTTFKTGSIGKLQVDSDEYQERSLAAYRKHKADYPNDTETKIFTNYNRYYFVFPTPTANGKSIDVWGLDMPATMASNSDPSIFGDSEPEADEAIVKKALSIALAKGKQKKEAQVEEQEAIGLLGNVWNRLKEDMADEQSDNIPFFNVPDFFGKGSSTPGNFNI